MASSAANTSFSKAPPAHRPTTADLLREPPLIQRRADPRARLKYGSFVTRDSLRKESQTTGPGASFSRLSTLSKRASSISIGDDDGQRTQRTSRSKPTLLPKYVSGCEAIKTRSAQIVSNLQKLLQQSADMFEELSVHNELDLGLQDSLQDVVRLVSEDSVAGRAVVDFVQDAVDVQSAWLTQMASAGYTTVDLAHIRKIDRIINEQEKLIATQKMWMQTMKNATDISAHVPLPRDPQQRWRWLQMHVKFGSFGQAKDSVRKRLQQIFFFRVKNIRRLKALKLAAASLNFQSNE